MSTKHGIIQDDWKTAKVIPIFKSDTKTDPGNYRPIISVLPALSQILERAVHSHLIDYLEKITNCQ